MLHTLAIIAFTALVVGFVCAFAALNMVDGGGR